MIKVMFGILLVTIFLVGVFLLEDDYDKKRVVQEVREQEIVDLYLEEDEIEEEFLNIEN